jgi:hypothetical protein
MTSRYFLTSCFLLFAITGCRSSEQTEKDENNATDTVKNEMLKKAGEQLKDSIKPDSTHREDSFKKRY